MAPNDCPSLPADFFHILSEQLSTIGDFATLYSCAVSSKTLASAGAINALYRISHESPLKGGGSEGLSLAEQGLNVQRWSILWRSVISSALGKTLYPYCRHLRMLDLRDLVDLLDDSKFRGRVSNHFFAKDLARFHLVDRRGRFDTGKIARAVGDEIVQHAPLLEQLKEPTNSNILSTALIPWAPQLEHLRSLAFFTGSALADEMLRNLLITHCPNIETLEVYQFRGAEADHALATFIGGMQENKLVSFENNSDCGIATETCLALTRHSRTLTSLKLGLSEEGILALGLLQSCTALETLSISTDRPSVDLKATQHDIFLEITEWLKNCQALTEISFSNVVSAPDLILPVLLNEEVRLDGLRVDGNKEEAMYVVKDHRDFHRALIHQPSLRRLGLQADPDPPTRDDVEIIMESLCSLPHLNELELRRISEFFGDDQIVRLAQSLPHLEEFSVGGFNVSDGVWSSVAMLENLKTVNFSGITTFTVDGILGYIDQLGPGNQGLFLSIDNADWDTAISQEQQDLLKDELAAKVDGRFDYVVMRDPNADAFDSDESD